MTEEPCQKETMKFFKKLFKYVRSEKWIMEWAENMHCHDINLLTFLFTLGRGQVLYKQYLFIFRFFFLIWGLCYVYCMIWWASRGETRTKFLGILIRSHYGLSFFLFPVDNLGKYYFKLLCMNTYEYSEYLLNEIQVGHCYHACAIITNTKRPRDDQEYLQKDVFFLFKRKKSHIDKNSFTFFPIYLSAKCATWKPTTHWLNWIPSRILEFSAAI